MAAEEELGPLAARVTGKEGRGDRFPHGNRGGVTVLEPMGPSPENKANRALCVKRFH